MNGEGKEEGVANMDVHDARLVYMWGYLPGALPQRSPILSPLAVRSQVYAWKDVCGGGCGFAMSISESGKLITWGSTDDLGQSYVTSGKHGETPEAFPLPPEVSIVKAAAGWAHCVAATDNGEVYTWGWKECIPSGKVFSHLSGAGGLEKDVFERKNLFFTEQGSPRSQGSRSSGGSGTLSGLDGRGSKDESTKRRRISSAKQAAESSSAGDETLSAFPCLVTLNPGVRIATVSAGGRHTLALSDTGQVWGWGYGGEGQLGLGSRIRMVSSPHPIPCIDSSYGKERAAVLSQGGMTSEGQGFRVPGTYIKVIACGGRHSAVITDAGALLTFGWGLYGQVNSCGLSPNWMNSYASFLSSRISNAGLFLVWDTPYEQLQKHIGKLPYYEIAPPEERMDTHPIKLFYFEKTQNFITSDAPLNTQECGQGSTDDELSPTCVSSLLGIRIEGVAAGLWHTVCVSADGDLYTFGGNQFGQLGTGGDQAETLPRLLEAPSLENIHAKIVSCGARHSTIITEDGKVFCWGWNKYGQLGLGDVIDRNVPSQVTIDGCVPKKVACGWWHTLLLAESPT